MSILLLTNVNEEECHVIKYIFDKLEKYAHKSRFWRLIHASHLRRNLLRRSRHLSKIHALSEELIRRCINQLFADVDQYVAQLYRLIYFQEFDGLISIFNSINKKNTIWYTMQIERAKNLFSKKQQMTDNDLLDNYYIYIKEKLTPTSNLSNEYKKDPSQEIPFDLNIAYTQAQSKAKEYLKNVIQTFKKVTTPNLDIIDEMIELGIDDMKKIPSREEFESSNHFLGRVLIFDRIKEAYKNVLKNTSEDFMLLQFGKVFGRDTLSSTQLINKQFFYLLHSFVKSIVILFTSLTTNINDNGTMAIQKLASLVFFDHDPSIIKLNNHLFSPEFNIDRWTWLLEQWGDILRTMPLIFTQVGAFSHLLRKTTEIGLIHLGKCAQTMIANGRLTTNTEFIDEQLFSAFQTGFYFGVVFAVVECLEDQIQNLGHIPLHHALVFDNDRNQTLTPTETVEKWIDIMEQLLTDRDFDRSKLPKTPLTSIITESFDRLLILRESNQTTKESFNQLALLLRSHRVDRKEFDQYYDDEQLYLGSILKYHFNYTCTTHLANIISTREESDRLWIMPFLEELTSDCRDFNDHMKSNSLTPFTYYASLIKRKEGIVNHLLNPFYTFLNLCSNIYLTSNRDNQIGAFLGRRIARTLRSVEITGDERSFREFLNIFSFDNPILYNYCRNKFRSQFPVVIDLEKSFFGALNLSSSKYAKTNRKLETYISENLSKIENALNILPRNPSEIIILEEQILLSTMNYSVKAGGKRLRPLLMLMIADMYDIELERLLPLTSGIEYLHTSSLIFDDLPAQDNSDLRRGQPSLHKTTINDDIPDNLCEGRAQLTAVDLIAVGMGLINNGLIKNGFLPERVNRVVGQISSLMHDLCTGQMMDLRAAWEGIEQDNKQLDTLDRIAWYKTGKTIEIVMITPIILIKPLSEQLNIELYHLRELSRLMGILFQMRDDLLDIEEDEDIGKPRALDLKNNKVTYVSILGAEGVRYRLIIFLNQSLQLVDHCYPSGSETIKDLIKYIVNRKT